MSALLLLAFACVWVRADVCRLVPSPDLAPHCAQAYLYVGNVDVSVPFGDYVHLWKGGMHPVPTHACTD